MNKPFDYSRPLEEQVPPEVWEAAQQPQRDPYQEALAQLEEEIKAREGEGEEGEGVSIGERGEGREGELPDSHFVGPPERSIETQ